MISWFESDPRNQRYRGAFWARLPPFPPHKALPVAAITTVVLILGAGAMIGLTLNDMLQGDTTAGVSQALYINPTEFNESDISPAGRNSLVAVSDDGMDYSLSLEVYGGDLYDIRLPLSNRGKQDLVVEMHLPWADQSPENPISVQVRGLYWFTDANHNHLYDYGEAMILTNDAILDPGDTVIKSGYAPFENYTLGSSYMDDNQSESYDADEAIVDQNGGDYLNLLEPDDEVTTAGKAALYKFSAVAVGPGKWRMLVPAAVDPIEYQITLAFDDDTPPGFYDLGGRVYPVDMSSGLKQLVEEPIGHNYDIDPGSVHVRLIGHDRAPDGNLVMRDAGGSFRLDLGSLARGQTFTYSAALGIVNEALSPLSVTGIDVTGEGADYMRIWLHTVANVKAESQPMPSESVLIWDGSNGEQSFSWDLAGGNDDHSDMWSRNTPMYAPAGVRALTTPWTTDDADSSDHVWVQVEVSIPQNAENGLYYGNIHFDYSG